MSDNIISFPSREKLTFDEIEPEVLLSAAGEVQFAQMMIIGWTEEGGLYLAATSGYNPDNMALLDVAKQSLVNFYIGE